MSYSLAYDEQESARDRSQQESGNSKRRLSLLSFTTTEAGASDIYHR